MREIDHEWGYTRKARRKINEDLVSRNWKFTFSISNIEPGIWRARRIMIDYNIYMAGCVLLNSEMNPVGFEMEKTEGWTSDYDFAHRYVRASKKGLDYVKRVLNGISPGSLVSVEEVVQ